MTMAMTRTMPGGAKVMPGLTSQTRAAFAAAERVRGMVDVERVTVSARKALREWPLLSLTKMEGA